MSKAENPAALLPCPFCGGEAERDKVRFGYPPSYWVKCANCGSSTTAYSNAEAADRSWDTRTPASRTQGETQ